MNGLNKIIDKITLDSKEKVSQIETETEETIKSLKLETLSEIEQLEKYYKEKTETDTSSIMERAKSSAQFEKRNSILSEKISLVSAIFEKAKEKILSYNEDEYVPFVSRILEFAIDTRIKEKANISALYGEEEAEIDLPYEVMFNKRDNERGYAKKIFLSVSGKRNDINIVLSDKVINIDGGFVLKCGEIETNCSVDSIIDEIRKKIEVKIIGTLFA